MFCFSGTANDAAAERNADGDGLLLFIFYFMHGFDAHPLACRLHDFNGLATKIVSKVQNDLPEM